MEIARWIVVVVGMVTAIGGLLADYVIWETARQHLKNPAWQPHAKFHNGQTVLMGLALGVVTATLPFLVKPLTVGVLLLAAVLGSLYWLCMLLAPLFPGTAWADPEFVADIPLPLGQHPQKLLAIVLLAALAVAVALALA